MSLILLVVKTGETKARPSYWRKQDFESLARSSGFKRRPFVSGSSYLPFLFRLEQKAILQVLHVELNRITVGEAREFFDADIAGHLRVAHHDDRHTRKVGSIQLAILPSSLDVNFGRVMKQHLKAK